MSASAVTQIALYFVILLGLALPVAWLLLAGMSGRGVLTSWLERPFWRLTGIDPEREMGWREYARILLLVNAIGFVVVYGLQRLQASLPLNPDAMTAVSPASSFNTAVSFVTNTNWQGYAGEVTQSHLTQMLGLAVQNFLSAATALAALMALARGLRRNLSSTVGNAWADMVRATVHVLLPLSFLLALLLASQGVVQAFAPAVHAAPLRPDMAEQVLPMGPAASQIAIKQLGTNGGGFFNVNSAHPFENPNPLSNLAEVLAILLIPVATCLAFGRWVSDMRQGWALMAAMLLILVPAIIFCTLAEQHAPPGLTQSGVDAGSAGNMEGKEVRFGVTNSALWASATTAASNGSVNSMHDSFTPLGGLVPIVLMQLGEVVFGGVGSGLYGMILFVILAVFVAGLMVGRTPEYLGKKIEPFEMKMATLGILLPCLAVLVGTGLSVALPAGHATTANPNAHGFSELLYAYSSASNNNGSAFAGLGADTPFHNLLLGLAMLLGRFGVMIPVLAIAGSLAARKLVPAGEGTLATHTPLFVGLLVSIVLVVGALTFLPALALGPIVEHLRMIAGGGS